MTVLSRQWNSPNEMKKHARNFVKNFIACPISDSWAETYTRSCPLFYMWDMDYHVFYGFIESFKSEFFIDYVPENIVGGFDNVVITRGGGFYDDGV